MDARKEKSLYCTVQNLELFSCSLACEQNTALSILEPVTINVELIPSELQNSLGSAHESAQSKALHDRMVQDAHTLKVGLRDITTHAHTHTHTHTRTHTRVCTHLSLLLPFLPSPFSPSLSSLPFS